MLREPVHHVTMIAGDPQLVTLTVADNIPLRQSVLLAEIDAKLHGFLVNGRKIRGIGQTVLADFKADMCIVRRTPSVPTTMIPRKRLVSGDTAVSQLADETVDADLPSVRLVLIPVVVVLIFTEQAVVGSDITFQIRVVRPGGMHHDAFWCNGTARLKAGVVYEDELSQVHLFILRSVVKLFQNVLQFLRYGQADVRGILEDGNTLVR